MKLTKENIYIDLRGKSNGELTELYNFLESVGEKHFRKTLNDFLETNKNYRCLHLCCGLWRGYDDDKVDEKTEVSINQLKEILQPMENKGEQLREEAKKRGYTHDNFKCLINRKSNGTKNIENWHYEEWADTLYSNSLGNGGQVVYKDGVWAEILQPMETLQEKEQRLLKELEEVRKEIEDSKIKVGDWCKFWDNDKDEFIIGKFQEEYEDTYVTSDTHFYNCKKITNPQLIELLENEIK